MPFFPQSTSLGPLLPGWLLALALGFQALAAPAWAVMGLRHVHVHAATVGDVWLGDRFGSFATVHDHRHAHVERHVHAPDDASVVPFEDSGSDDALDQPDGTGQATAVLALIPSFAKSLPPACPQRGVAGPSWTCTSRSLVRLDRPPNLRARIVARAATPP